MDVVAERLDDGLGGEVQRADVDGDVLAALHHRVALGVAQRGGEVAAVDDERVAGAQDLLRHLVDDRHERVLEDLERDGVELVVGLGAHDSSSCSICMRMFSHSSTSTFTPGGTSTVESSWSISAGPSKRRAGGQVVAGEDRRLDRVLAAVEDDLARAGGLGLAAVGVVARQLGLLGLADRAHVELVDLDRRVLAAVAVLALVLVVERLDDRVERLQRRLHLDRQRAPLADVAHVDLAREADAVLGDALGVEHLARLLLEPRERLLDLGGVDLVGLAAVHLREVVADVDEQAAERGGDARVRRHDHGRDHQLLGERRAVQRAGAAEHDERELARVVALADRDQPDGVGHVGVRDLDHRARRVDRVEPERLGDLVADRRLGGVAVELHAAADQLRPEPAEQQVGVGVRRLLAAAAVAGRPGLGARGLRAVAQRAGLVDPGQRAAAGADREHLDAREADRIAVLDRPLLGHLRLALVDERDVGAGAAHVEPDRVVVAAQRGDVARGDRARGDARGGEADGELLDRPRRHHAAAGVQQQQVALVAALARARRRAATRSRRRAARARRWRPWWRSARARRSPAAPRRRW